MALRKRVLEEKKEKAILARFNKAVKEGKITYAEMLAHQNNIPHQCDTEDMSLAWNACVNYYEGDREEAAKHF